jgi:hypothetical protein
VKRIIAAAAAVVALAGCGTAAAANGPDALDLASRIRQVTPTNGEYGDIPQTYPTPTTVARVRAGSGLGQDIVATFSTNAARTTWVRSVAALYGSNYNTDRVDGDRWTMITTESGGGPGDRSSNITDTAVDLHGRIVPISSKL